MFVLSCTRFPYKLSQISRRSLLILPGWSYPAQSASAALALLGLDRCSAQNCRWLREFRAPNNKHDRGVKMLNSSVESGHNPQFSGEVEAYWYFRKCMCLLLSAQMCFRETALKAVALSHSHFQALHYLFLCFYFVFPYRSLAFLWNIMDLLFTISYTCSIVPPPSQLRTIGEVSAFLNKMLANINAGIDLFVEVFVLFVHWQGQELVNFLQG